MQRTLRRVLARHVLPQSCLLPHRSHLALYTSVRALSWSQRLTSFLQKGDKQTNTATTSTTSTTSSPDTTRTQCDALLDACLDLLELCGEDTTTSLYTLAAVPNDNNTTNTTTNKDKRMSSSEDAELQAIRDVVYVLMHDTSMKPSAQFDLVYNALCLPLSCHSLNVKRGLMVLLASVLPEPLYVLFERTDLIVPTPLALQEQQSHNDNKGHRQVKEDAMYDSTSFTVQDAARRNALVRLVHALLGDIDPTYLTTTTTSSSSPPLREEELLAVWIADVEQGFPQLRTSSHWNTLVTHKAVEMALRARMLARLAELCAAFDRNKTGKVKLAELRATAMRVLKDEQAVDKLLAGAVPDAEGQLRYGQLVTLLARPSQ